MTTRSRARIYRGASRPLTSGACPQCSRIVGLLPSGKRRAHRDRNGDRCPGSNVHVGDWQPVKLADLPLVEFPTRSLIQNNYRREPVVTKPPDPRVCVCGQKPRRKANGEFAAHRVDVDNPATPYCPNGATRSRQ